MPRVFLSKRYDLTGFNLVSQARCRIITPLCLENGLLNMTLVLWGHQDAHWRLHSMMHVWAQCIAKERDPSLEDSKSARSELGGQQRAFQASRRNCQSSFTRRVPSGFPTNRVAGWQVRVAAAALRRAVLPQPRRRARPRRRAHADVHPVAAPGGWSVLVTTCLQKRVFRSADAL